MTLLSASRICVTLTGTEVLHDVSLRIDAGEIVTIVGPNGSGKSTLLRALLGILPVTHGTVTQSPGLRIGYVPQRLQIDRTLPLTVRRFLSLPTRRSTAEATAALARTGVPDVAQKQMTDLSGGQLQRVLLARALLTKPDLLILDEPTQGLDQPGEAAFYRLIEEVRRDTGAAVLMVSHDLHVVMSASDRVICLNGHVCCEGTPLVVSNAPEYRALFGLGTQGALALYQHDHDHDHTHDHDHHHHHGHAADHHDHAPAAPTHADGIPALAAAAHPSATAAAGTTAPDHTASAMLAETAGGHAPSGMPAGDAPLSKSQTHTGAEGIPSAGAGLPAHDPSHGHDPGTASHNAQPSAPPPQGAVTAPPDHSATPTAHNHPHTGHRHA